MAERKKRSRSWAVSIHVLASGVAMPILGTVIGETVSTLLSSLVGGSLALAALVFLVVLTTAYAVGTVYSLAYIRDYAFLDDPEACTWPSILAFAAITLVWSSVNLYRAEVGLAYAIVVLFYFLLIIIGFSILTSRGFERMADELPESPGEENAAA
ncbi:MAG: hypothetical protein V5A84_02205 [Planctomycetota bacterium]